jgi:hypothetical protein
MYFELENTMQFVHLNLTSVVGTCMVPYQFAYVMSEMDLQSLQATLCMTMLRIF